MTLQNSMRILSFTLSNTFLLLYHAAHYCSTPNSAPTSAELNQCTAVWGSIIIHHATLLSLSLLSTLSHAIVIYSPGKQKEITYSAPIEEIELKFWGKAQKALT